MGHFSLGKEQSDSIDYKNTEEMRSPKLVTLFSYPCNLHQLHEVEKEYGVEIHVPLCRRSCDCIVCRISETSCIVFGKEGV